MLDIKLIRENPAAVERALATRGVAVSLAPVLAADAERRRLVTEAEELKAERNRASEAIGQAKRRGEDAQAATAHMREVSDRIKALDARVKEADARLEGLLLEIPNVPQPSVPVGASADNNVEVRRWGTPRSFAFEPKQHFEIGEALGILDFDRASKIAKARFTVMWGAASRLSRALAQFMLDLHTREHGFTEVWVPPLVNPETMVGVAMLPKFEEQMFKTLEPDAGRTLFLIPTAEVSLTALHGGEILAEAELPRRYCAFTPCYRREAGTYGQDTKGMIRQHQFDKVEMVKVTTPAQSQDEHEAMVRSAEVVLQRLELPYRVMALCTGDMGFHSAKTYDLEVWLPGQGKYREISSCSNCEAYQARRLDLRYRPASGGRVELCHTLNGSGVAVGRALVAVLENYQEADGSVTVPAVLRPYMGGLERIGPPVAGK
ncbi:MAG TPA: serine--tRNA ligase [Patescibacteria group bacterium]|nr:serine--tRNA ligase [Patescibacteria group bacterium]